MTPKRLAEIRALAEAVADWDECLCGLPHCAVCAAESEFAAKIGPMGVRELLAALDAAREERECELCDGPTWETSAPICNLCWNSLHARAEKAEASAGVLRSALQRHDRWHQAQIDECDLGFIPADEYADSSLYQQTAKALATDAGRALLAELEELRREREIDESKATRTGAGDA